MSSDADGRRHGGWGADVATLFRDKVGDGRDETRHDAMWVPLARIDCRPTFRSGRKYGGAKDSQIALTRLVLALTAL